MAPFALQKLSGRFFDVDLQEPAEDADGTCMEIDEEEDEEGTGP